MHYSLNYLYIYLYFLGKERWSDSANTCITTYQEVIGVFIPCIMVVSVYDIDIRRPLVQLTSVFGVH